MHKNIVCWMGMVIFLLTGCVGFSPWSIPAAQRQPDYWPEKEWRISTPEEQGMDSEMLVQLFQQVADKKLNLHSLLIVRNGTLVTEAYFHPYTPEQPHMIASVTKSVIGTLVGIAIQKGYIKDTDQTLVSFFADQTIANLDERKRTITLKDLLSLTAGLQCNDAPLSGEPGMEQSDDWVQFMLDAPMAEQPGTKFNYCGGAVHLLSAVIQKTTGMTARDFANRFLFDPLGIPAVPENRWPLDPQGISTGPYGLYLTPRDLARLGYLYLQDGKWGSQQIISPEWVKAASTSHTTKENGLGYGYLWTVDPEQGSYSALGFAGQQIYVIPKKNLVVVFTAALPSTKPDEDYIPLKALLDTYILPSVKSDRPLAANTGGSTQLSALVQKASQPEAAVQPIPEGAFQWSGMVYEMDDNPMGWQKVSIDCKKGEDILRFMINDTVLEPPVGLDNRFRIEQRQDGRAPEAFRGYWESETTLVVQEVVMGELLDTEFRVVFSNDSIDVTGKRIVYGVETRVHGKRAGK